MQLSIVTITYNDPLGLKKTVESLKSVSAQLPVLEWEHLIVDSSPEKNNETIEVLSKSPWPLRHIVSPPKGIYAAMNEGVENATGQWIWFLNGGDQLADVDTLKYFFEYHFNEMNTQDISKKSFLNYDLTVFGAELYRGGKLLYQQYPPFNTLWMNLVGFNRICHQSIFFKRDVFNTVGKFDVRYSLAADYDHLLRCNHKGMQVNFLNKILVKFDMGGQSSNFQSVLKEMKTVQENHLSPLLESFAHKAVWNIEKSRIEIQKHLAHSKLAPVLKPTWTTFKRLQARAIEVLKNRTVTK